MTRQTRRSVSVRGITYARMKEYADQEGETISGLAEAWVGEKMDALGIRTFTPEEAEALRPKNGGRTLEHPDKRANEQRTIEPRAPSKAPVVLAPRGEDLPPREARPAKEPTVAVAPSGSPPRGGGVHSF